MKVLEFEGAAMMVHEAVEPGANLGGSFEPFQQRAGIALHGAVRIERVGAIERDIA